MPLPASLARRIAKLQRQRRLGWRDADALTDMLHAERAEVPACVDFVEKYLPVPAKLPLRRTKPDMIASDADLARARRNIANDPISAELWRELLAHCDQYRDPRSSEHVDWQKRRNLKLWDRRQGHWWLTVAMQDLAWCGAIKRDVSLTRYAAEILVTIAKHRQGWAPMHCNYGRIYKGWLFDNLLDVGHITLGSAITYDLVKGVLADDERAEVAAYFEPFFARALTFRFEALHNPGHNFAPIGFGGTGLLALALADQYPLHRHRNLVDTLAWAQAYSVFSLDHIAGTDGAAIEGSGYGSASLYYASLFMRALLRRSGRDLFTHPILPKLARYLAIESLPGGGAINNFNDNHYQTHVAFWPMIARQNGNRLADWLWHDHAAPGKNKHGPREKDSLCNAPYVLLFREPDADTMTPESLGVPRVHHFKGLDHLTMRTGWNQRDLHVTFQCTKPPVNAHTQYDRLNYTVYALGERFVIDSGYGMVPLPGSSEVKRMGAHGESHNQVLIDGKGQTSRKGVDTGRIVRWKREGEWAWCLGDATGSYEQAKLARRLLAVRLTADTPAIVQVDWIVPNDTKSHRYETLLQTGEKNRVTLGKRGDATIIGRDHGSRLSACYTANAPAKASVGEWIDHPRIKWTSIAREHVGILVLGTGTLRRESATHVTWHDARGDGDVSVYHKRGALAVSIGGAMGIAM